jgi:outer membrane protein assembly factor BamB
MAAYAGRKTGLREQGEVKMRAGDFKRGGVALGLGLGLLLTLAACAEREVILPGAREDLRAVLSDENRTAPEATPENRVEAISLPPARSNANWTQSPGSPETRVAHPAYSGALQPVWNANIGVAAGARSRITAEPVVADGRIFTLDAQAGVSATATSGAPLWHVDLVPARDRGKEATGGGLAVAGDTLFVTSGFGVLSALDVASGAVKWQQKLAADATGAPTVKNGIVFLVAGDSTAWAVDAQTGRIQWQFDTTKSRNNILGAPAPAANDQVVIFGFGSGELQAAFRGGGFKVWGAVLSGQRPAIARSRVTGITGDPVIVGDTVFAGTQAGRLAALKASTGERLWTAREGVMGTVWVAGGSVFFVTDRNQLERASAEDGSRIWAVELPLFVKDRPRKQKAIYYHHGPVLAGGKLILASTDGVIRMFDPASGKLIGTGSIPGGAATAPVFAGGVMYIVSKKGVLYAYR